jgi:glycosyltransferase involved in cell wall biosynthesis
MMKLVIVSHKENWRTADGYTTVGGFPLQMEALSQAFDQSTVLLPLLTSTTPKGAVPFSGHNMTVETLGILNGRNNWRRKVAVLSWWLKIWLGVRKADIVHIPLPGDIGTLGLIISWLQRKPLFVRYCGPWGRRTTATEKFLYRFLTRIARGQRTIVFATGGGETPPEPNNPHIHWIHSTTLNHAEWQQLPQAQPWRPNTVLKLVTVGRLTPVKNHEAIIRALPAVMQLCPNVQLHIVGGGPLLERLTAIAHELNLVDKVVFHGSVGHEAVLRLLSESHLFVFPSEFEGFPKALLEALACGLPAIATNVSVIPHLIGDRCGILLDDTSAPAVADAILHVISDDARMAEMGRSARAESGAYTLEQWVLRYAELIGEAWGVELNIDRIITS